MQVEVKFSGKTRKIKTNGKTIENVLKEMKINTEAVLVKKNGKITPIEDELKDEDVLELVEIVSSG